MRNVEAREIDGAKYTVQQLGGRAAGKLFVRLSSYLFPALGQGAELLGKLDLSKGLSSDVDVGSIARGLGAAAKVLFDKLTPEEYEALLAQLLETARIAENGKDLPLWPIFDDAMAGKVLTQLKLLTFALEVNFKDFLPALGALNSAAAAGAAARLQASTTSSQSGDAGA